MAISQSAKVDFLWKKVIFGTTKSDSDTAKAGNNESIASPLPGYAALLWAQTSITNIPATPPGATTATVQVYKAANRIATTADATAGTPGNRPTWLTSLTDWVPPTFGSGYAVEVFLGDPQTTGVQIFPLTTNEEWVFDYNAGILHFPTNLPTGNAQWVNGVYIRGYRYVGTKGAGSSQLLYDENGTPTTAPNAAGSQSIALGDGALANHHGAVAQAAGRFTNSGDAQIGSYIMRGITTNATLTEIFLDGASDKLLMSSNTARAFSITIIARRTDSGSEGAVYELRGGIDKVSTSGSTRLIGGVNKTNISEDSPAWDVQVSADTFVGALALKVQGEVGKTIRWVAHIRTVEVMN